MSAMISPGTKRQIILVDPDAATYYEHLCARLTDCELVLIGKYALASQVIPRIDMDLLILNHSEEIICREIFSLFRLAKPLTPIIIIASKGSEDLAVRVFRCGAKDFFTKPLNMDELQFGIEVALGRKDYSPVYCGKEGIDNAISYIKRSYAENVSLGRAAREAGMSISNFERVFKKYTGTTFNKYVNRLKIGMAAELLRVDNLSIMEIALACGFNNQCHFTRTFRKIKNTSPGVYRKSIVKRARPYPKSALLSF